jgi:hypothetical protein
MGAELTGNGNKEQGLSFQLGREKAHVLVLKPEELAQRNAILDAILNLSALRYTYQLVYLAAPRLFGASVDAMMFRSRGIGLLFYDERRIDEAVPAQSLQPEQATARSPDDDKAVVTELATLRTMYVEMERTINQLRDDLSSLHNPRPVREEPRILPATEVITTPPSFHQDRINVGELPSYFVNNPWLDVLAKRGSGERERIAG